jgi:hypothetical protein
VAQLMGHREALMGGKRGPSGTAAIDNDLPAPVSGQQRSATRPQRRGQADADAEGPADTENVNRPFPVTGKLCGACAELFDQRRLGFSPMNARIGFAPPGRSKDSCSRFKAGSSIGHSW